LRLKKRENERKQEIKAGFKSGSFGSRKDTAPSKKASLKKGKEG
jgi:hypothetical protein